MRKVGACVGGIRWGQTSHRGKEEWVAHRLLESLPRSRQELRRRGPRTNEDLFVSPERNRRPKVPRNR